MATKRIFFGFFLLLVTQEAQGIVTSCTKSAHDMYSEIAEEIFPDDCGKEVNTICYVKCRAPAKRQMQIKCNINGLWEDNNNCLRIIPECDKYSNRGVIVRSDCVRDVGKTCDVSCNGGGNMKISCNSSRQWEETYLDPPCVRGCPELDLKNANELSNKSDDEIGKTIQFTCHEHFVIQGHEKLTCQTNYTWDHSAPFCESRRFAHEVVKAMENSFFSMINNKTSREVDLIILLDVSRNESVRITVDLVKSLLLRCEENQRGKFYTLITYGKEGHVNCTVCNREMTIQELNNVATHPHKPAGSNLGSGLSRIFTQLLLGNHLSRDRDRILLIVTGKNPGISHNHELWTKILREDAAFKMFIVALGDDVNKDELSLMANRRWQDHFFHLKYSQIHEAVGNLTDNGSVIVNDTGQLVQQLNRLINAGTVCRLIMYLEVLNSPESFELVKKVALKMLQCMNQPELKVFLNVDNAAGLQSVESAIEILQSLQASELRNWEKLQNPNAIATCNNKNVHDFLLVISSSGDFFENNSTYGLKYLDYETYAVGVGDQPEMNEMQDFVSFPWYRHLARVSEAPAGCGG